MTASIDIDAVLYHYAQIHRQECGQVRRNLLSGGNLVELVMGHLGPGLDHHVASWTVSDLLTGKEYELRIGEIGEEIFNEMEALAWVVMRSQKQ